MSLVKRNEVMASGNILLLASRRGTRGVFHRRMPEVARINADPDRVHGELGLRNDSEVAQPVIEFRGGFSVDRVFRGFSVGFPWLRGLLRMVPGGVSGGIMAWWCEGIRLWRWARSNTAVRSNADESGVGGLFSCIADWTAESMT